MNILFIGSYRHGIDGWGQSSISTIKALSTTEHNLSIRPIYMTNKQSHIEDSLLLELENTKYHKYDVIIQHVLPHLLDYQPKLGKNIAMFELETGNLNYTSWPHHINTMNECWVTSYAEVKALQDSGVKIPICKTGQSVDLDKFDKQYEPLFDKGDAFVFYFIGEFIERKGIFELLLAYFSEFHRNENVLLVIKTNANQQDIENFVKNVQGRLSMYNNFKLYPQLKVINQYLSENDINRLHTTCDCFVMPSYGESVCLPVLDAIGFGNPPIVTDNTGMIDFVNNSCGDYITSTKEMVHTAQRPLQDLYTGYETWYKPNILSLRKKMRDMFQFESTYQVIRKNCKKVIQNFSHEKVGQELAKLL